MKLFFEKDLEMKIAIRLKRYVAGASVFRINISKFGHYKKLSPMILFEIDKNFEISVYITVLSFSLTINLKMERR